MITLSLTSSRDSVTILSLSIMPAPIPVSHDDVKASFLLLGSLKEAAKTHGLKPETVRQWAKREGWETAGNALALQRKADDMARKVMERKKGEPVTLVTPAEVIADSFERDKETFRAGMSSGLSRAAGVIAVMPGEEVVESSRKVHDLVQAGSKLFGIGQDQGGPSLTLNLLSLSADALRP